MIRIAPSTPKAGSIMVRSGRVVLVGLSSADAVALPVAEGAAEEEAVVDVAFDDTGIAVRTGI